MTPPSAQTLTPPHLNGEERRNIDAAYDLIAKVPVSGRTVLDHAAVLPREERGAYLIAAATHFAGLMPDAHRYRLLPVDLRTFVESRKYLGRRGIVYPAVMEALVEMNDGTYVESVLTGGIGSGKTTAALLGMAWQHYLLSVLKDPHRDYGLDPASEILSVFQSLNARTARDNDYTRFRNMIAASPYFREVFPLDAAREAEMVFPRRIVARSLTGNVHAAIGANVMNAVLDEVNFMRIVEDSAQSADGGVFDQALEMYNGIVRRRKSRFLKHQRLPGMIYLVSSKRYPGEFTDRKIEEARRERDQRGRSSIFVYDRTVYDIKPAGTYGAARWSLFLGDATRRPRILNEEEGASVPPEDAHLIRRIPHEFKSEFEHDLLSAIRDIAGCSTLAMNPYLINTEAVAAAFGARPSVLSLERTDFVTTRPAIHREHIAQPQEPRLAHVDLAVSGDSAGVAIGYVERFVDVSRSGSTIERLPKINFDLVLEVKPPRNGEIEFESLRRLFYALRESGMNLKWISFDTYQSRDSIQLLRQQGFVTGTQSMDADSTAYDVAKTALYDGRVAAPRHEHARTELIRLERDPKTGRIDHPAGFSKDCADAMAGVIYGLTYRRDTWARHGESMAAILQSIAQKIDQKDVKSETARAAGQGRHRG
ncbi:hypothetical protein [Reyranella sp.]|uniref:hypothetical protein n=1 Tax=Reyranella sp. TaxID=1929291 RepID=UPI001227AD8E|nr:hypothetical protein [Reyranella sp.]TAJ84626.1 MAG: hypothetical protein EPO50_18250 [Reyranella sp.]